MLLCAAPRRPRFVGACGCECAVCAEREQLALTASFGNGLVTRMLAVSFLGMIEAIDQGAIGGVALDNLFD